MALLASKKDKDKGKKGKKEAEAPIPEAPREIPKPKFDESPREYNLSDPRDFLEMLKLKVPRPFTFGPLMFDGLDGEFDMGAAYESILDTLEQRSILGEQ